MTDAFEDQARALAYQVAPLDVLRAERSIPVIAIGLRETWRMATEAAEEKCALLEQRAETAEAERDRLAAHTDLLKEEVALMRKFVERFSNIAAGFAEFHLKEQGITSAGIKRLSPEIDAAISALSTLSSTTETFKIPEEEASSPADEAQPPQLPE